MIKFQGARLAAGQEVCLSTDRGPVYFGIVETVRLHAIAPGSVEYEIKWRDSNPFLSRWWTEHEAKELREVDA